MLNFHRAFLKITFQLKAQLFFLLLLLLKALITSFSEKNSCFDIHHNATAQLHTFTYLSKTDRFKNQVPNKLQYT